MCSPERLGPVDLAFAFASPYDGRREAEKRGMAVLCPLGNDSLDRPTEWRGAGELHVLYPDLFAAGSRHAPDQ